MKKTVNAFLVFSVFSLWLGMARLVPAQPVLERLERRIRERLGQTTDATGPAERRPGLKPEEPAGEQPAENAGRGAIQQPGYVGIVADDVADRGRGVRVLDVRPGGPADKGGLRKQDLITGVAGIRVRQMADMADVLDLFSAGDPVTFDILREGKQQTVKVTLDHRPAPARQTPPPEPKTVPIPGAAAPEAGPDAGDQPGQPAAAGPRLPAPGPASPTDPAAQIEQLNRRIEQLERRVAELERALANALKKEG